MKAWDDTLGYPGEGFDKHDRRRHINQLYKDVDARRSTEGVSTQKVPTVKAAPSKVSNANRKGGSKRRAA